MSHPWSSADTDKESAYVSPFSPETLCIFLALVRDDPVTGLCNVVQVSVFLQSVAKLLRPRLVQGDGDIAQ